MSNSLCNHRMTLPIPQSYFIWYCAWLSLPSAIYAYTRFVTTDATLPTTSHLAIIPASVFVTSLLYWRKPLRNSWRRKLDIATVILGFSYQTHYALKNIHYNSSAIVAYTTLIGCSAGLYFLSNYFMICGRIWPAVYTHASIHIFANIANIVLYSSIENIQMPKIINM